MNKKNFLRILVCFILFVNGISKAEGAVFLTLSADDVRDKIRGGLLGQLLGNLNGLEHEMEYIEEPGKVESYTPSLRSGAWTDDDTDFEWVYIYTMQQENEIFLSPGRITKMWKESINRNIWCSNLYARNMMDIGFEPPLTGNVVLNPWANFNISGQFLCESFGLLSPAMPQTAAKIGLNYTLVAIDGEPAQATQLFTSMIATAFVSDSIEEIIEAGTSSIDGNSKLNEIVANVRKWHKEFPDDWRSTRKLVKEKYTRFGGAMRDKNGYELNTASIIAALLYGKGDPALTLRIAFNFGWDADCNAATVGTIVGTMKGYRWMMSQGWTIVDRYANKTRENMPDDETITSFADRLIDLAEIVIARNGGSRKIVDGKMVYYIRAEKAGNVRKLTDFTKLQGKMLKQFTGEIELGLKEDASKEQRAKAAYLALCLGNFEEIKNKDQKNWDNCLAALREYPGMIEEIFRESCEYGVGIQQAAVKAGLK